MQQIPGRFKGNEGEVRLDVYTFLNPMNNYWGQRRITGIYPTRTLVNYEGANAQGQYVNKLPTDKNGPQASVGSSKTDFVWLSFARLWQSLATF